MGQLRMDISQNYCRTSYNEELQVIGGMRNDKITYVYVRILNISATKYLKKR